MRNSDTDNTLFPVARIWQFMIVSVFLVTLMACGEVDENDGEVVNSFNLPTDSALTLYCPDAGIGGESCILDDPDNPYAITAVNDTNKFQLSIAAPSTKARFYLWATAQAMSPRGENQYYVGAALQELYGDSGSELAREQALKAYRSVLDNYFYSVTYFEATWVGGDEIFYPYPVRKLVGENMHSPSAPLTSLFDDPAEALQLFGEWGYTYDDVVTKDFTPNF